MLIKLLTREALFINQTDIQAGKKMNRTLSCLKFVYLFYKYQRSYFSPDRKDMERKLK